MCLDLDLLIKMGVILFLLPVGLVVFLSFQLGKHLRKRQQVEQASDQDNYQTPTD